MRKFGSCGIILIAAAVCATAVACTPDDGNVEYTPKRNATLTGNFYVSRSPYEETERVDSVCYNEQHAYYVFQSDIAPKTRDDVMDTAEEILEKFGYSDIKFHTLTNCITGYVDGQLVGEGYYSGMDSGMFLCLDDFSPLYITLTCNQKKYGADVNYGLLYALSYGQCADWGYDLPERPSDKEIAKVIEQTPEISTLNTAVFQTNLTTAEMKRAAEGLAVKLYEKLSVAGLITVAASDSPNEATRIYANGLCYSLGVEPLVYDPLESYKTYQTAWYMVAESQNVRVFFSKVYSDRSYPYFGGLCDYFSLLQAIPRQVAELKEYMGVTQCPRLEILYDGSFFTGPEWEGTSISGMTFVGWVQCASVFCTVHELTHLLTWYKTDGAYVNEDSLNVWTAEAFPTYMAAMFDENYFAAESYVWGNDNDGLGIDDVLTLLHEMLASHPITNNIEYFDLYAYCLEETGRGSFTGWGWVDNLKLKFATAVSLVNYLIERYGKDKFMDLYYTHGATEESVYGKDFELLYREWIENLKVKFES